MRRSSYHVANIRLLRQAIRRLLPFGFRQPTELITGASTELVVLGQQDPVVRLGVVVEVGPDVGGDILETGPEHIYTEVVVPCEEVVLSPAELIVVHEQ